MAAILPLITSAVKALPQAAKSSTKDNAKKFISGRREVAKNKNVEVTSNQKMIGGSKVISYPQLPPAEKASTTPKTSSTKLVKRIDNILSLTVSIDKITKLQYTEKVRKSRVERRLVEKEKKRKIEDEIEKGKTNFGIGGFIGGVAKKSGLLNFLWNTLLGGLTLWSLDNIPKIEKAFDLMSENLYATFLILRGGFQSIVGSFKLAGKLISALVKNLVFKPIGNTIGLIGKGISKLGDYILDLARAGRNAILNALGFAPRGGGTNLTGSGGAGGSARRYVSPRIDSRGNVINTSGRQYRENLGRQGAPNLKSTRPGSAASLLRGFLASLQTGTAFGGFGGGVQRSLYSGAVKANKFISKIFGPKAATELAAASPALQRFSKVARGVRIPIVGPIIVAVSSLLSGEPPSQTLFKSIGAGAGEALGTLFPVPIIGTIIGGLLGEYLGDIIYTFFEGGGLDGVVGKIKKDFESMLKTFKIQDLISNFSNWAFGLMKKDDNKPRRNQFKRGGQGTAQYNRALKEYNAQKNASKPEVIPITPDPNSVTPPDFTAETPQSSIVTAKDTSKVASSISQSASYEDGAEEIIYVPLPSPPQQSSGGYPRSASPIVIGGSTKSVLNSYYKSQLLGFLYKQG